MENNKKLLQLTNDVLEKLPDDEPSEEEVFGTHYYGPIGEYFKNS